jgi:hypothetical protein
VLTALARSASDVLLLLLGLLVPKLPTVDELRQQLANPFDVAAGPDVNGDAASRKGFGCGYFFSGDIPAKGRNIQT